MQHIKLITQRSLHSPDFFGNIDRSFIDLFQYFNTVIFHYFSNYQSPSSYYDLYLVLLLCFSSWSVFILLQVLIPQVLPYFLHCRFQSSIVVEELSNLFDPFLQYLLFFCYDCLHFRFYASYRKTGFLISAISVIFDTHLLCLYFIVSTSAHLQKVLLVTNVK